MPRAPGRRERSGRYGQKVETAYATGGAAVAAVRLSVPSAGRTVQTAGEVGRLRPVGDGHSGGALRFGGGIRRLHRGRGHRLRRQYSGYPASGSGRRRRAGERFDFYPCPRRGEVAEDLHIPAGRRELPGYRTGGGGRRGHLFHRLRRPERNGQQGTGGQLAGQRRRLPAGRLYPGRAGAPGLVHTGHGKSIPGPLHAAGYRAAADQLQRSQRGDQQLFQRLPSAGY